MSRSAVFVRSAETGFASDGASPRDFVVLLKPRVASLVAFTGFVGMVLADGALHPILAVTAIFCIAIGAGAAGAINMWYEADIDGRMERTRNRPIPAGRMEPGTALGFGVVTAIASVSLLGLATNWMAAALLTLAILFYVFVYTLWLKRRTPQNIVIGGAAGAIPPLIGWAAVTGEIHLFPMLLFAIIFMWTPPHFWSLSLYKSDDYERAGVPMLPVIAGLETTRRHILGYSLVLVPLTLLPFGLGYAHAIYGAGAVALGAVFVALTMALWRRATDALARRVFAFSIMYLFLIFSLLLADHAWPVDLF
ncbi:MAG: heme o synthase [Proteobacteria bacterium]|nr:heme o synthase [Pseudomonadota bacterium]